MSGTAPAEPLSAAAFAGLMAAVGPFEAAPHLAVAVSGGADSMALCLLADEWARRKGGRVTAVTVNHGLRPEAAAEAAQVGRWLAERGIDHRILDWQGTKPATGIQAAARAARYRLMEAWCRGAGVLHLLLAHHLEDQAATFLLRLERDSGADGLAAMSAVSETPSVRLVRPLLGVSSGALRAVLGERRQDWAEDPSNRNPRFARTRARAALAVLADAGFPADRLGAATRRLGRARIALEDTTGALLARCCAVHPAGFAEVDPALLMTAAEEVSLKALARIVVCMGGATYGPRRDRLERLHAWLCGGQEAGARTLGRCRIVPAGGRLVVCREGRGTPPAIAAVPGTEVVWDNRFVVGFAGDGGDGVFLDRLGRRGWAEVLGERPELRQSAIPAAVRPSLPALVDSDGVCAVPHLGYRRERPAPSARASRLLFRPPETLSGRGFFLA